MSERGKRAPHPDGSSEGRRDVEEGEAHVSRRLEMDEDGELSTEEEAEILKRLHALGYL